MYFQTAYQLNFHTDFPIPEFLAGDGTAAPDVLIRHGAVPTDLENPSGRGVVYQATANQFLLKMDEIARYLVQNGNEIIIECAPGSLESDVRVFLLGSCIGALLHQRGLLVMHAGAIHTEKGALLFTGHSGCGKSTILGELMRRGYKMMVDDVCGVRLDEHQTPVVLPGYPRTRLWLDSAKKLEQDIQQLERTRPTLEKYERQAPQQFWDQPAPLRRIYLLGSSKQNELFLQVEPRINTFSIVLHNTYRQQFLDGLEMRAPHFGLASAMAKYCAVTRVTRPSQLFRLAELADLIEQDLEQP
jgi:hypothetical protein